MYIEQIYTSCLAEAAYYIESEGEAAIIDPLRDISIFLEMAERRKASIKYVLETHFHADFVSGHFELADKSGARIVYGQQAKARFDYLELKDQQEIQLGKIIIRALHTPGHTLESTTYLLIDETGKEHAIFSGDTLFIGDVGRPDLAVKSDLTEKDLAGMLYDSLRNKILPLPDDVIVYPGHGQGSACGKNMSKERFDTLGNQRNLNYALNPGLSREDFIEMLTTGLTAAPQYFPKNVLLNQNGYEKLEEIISKGKRALSPEDFKQKLDEIEGSLILDTRPADEFAKEYIPGSLFVGLDGQFAPWVGNLVEDLRTPLLIVGDEDRVEEVITRLSRVGYDNTIGYLEGGIKAWNKLGFPTISLEETMPLSLADQFGEIEGEIVDVRRVGEYSTQHLRDVSNKPLDDILQNWKEYSANDKYYLYCAGGYRSVIAASWLKRHGIDNVVNIKGGFSELKKTNIPMDVPETAA